MLYARLHLFAGHCMAPPPPRLAIEALNCRMPWLRDHSHRPTALHHPFCCDAAVPSDSRPQNARSSVVSDRFPTHGTYRHMSEEFAPSSVNGKISAPCKPADVGVCSRAVGYRFTSTTLLLACSA